MSLAAKPAVRKIAGVWVMQCSAHSIGEIFHVFRPEHWRDPWQAAQQCATTHAVGFHERPWDNAEEVQP